MIYTFLFVLKRNMNKKRWSVHSTKKERIWRWLPKWCAHAGLDVVFDWERRDAFSRQPLGDALFSWTERYHCLTTLINTVVRFSNASVHKIVGLMYCFICIILILLVGLWAACDWFTPCYLMEICIVRFGNKVYLMFSCMCSPALDTPPSLLWSNYGRMVSSKRSSHFIVSVVCMLSILLTGLFIWKRILSEGVLRAEELGERPNCPPLCHWNVASSR